jgi:hypothetical protein
LQAFLRRQDPEQRRMIEAVGLAYAEGRLDVSEVATILNADPAEATWLLEEHGFCRGVEAMTLSPADRERRFTRVREERLSRQSLAVADADLIRRDVISSQRIEGVDARPWLPPRR